MTLLQTVLKWANEGRSEGWIEHQLDGLCVAPCGGRMHSVQRDVEQFHRALDLPVGESPAIRRPELRSTLIAEEVVELLEALTGDVWLIERADADADSGPADLAHAIKEMCDVLCVVYGTAVESGVDLAPFWEAVHASNMAKRGGPVRGDGKRLKPEGWVAPDVAGILERVSAGGGR